MASLINKVLHHNNNKLSPQKRQPDEYFKSVWVPKQLYEGVILVAKFYKMNIRQTILLFIAEGIKKHIALLVKAEIENREEVIAGNRQYRRPSEQLKQLRAYIAETGDKNPRIDRGYKVI